MKIQKVLVVNCGSSSLKFQLFDMTGEKMLCKGLVERIGIAGSRLVYTQTGCEKIVREKPGDTDRAHHTAVRYVSANGQAKAARAMIASGFLTDEEIALFKRARNHRSMSRPANADPKVYKIATGFEALLGYLYLADKRERLREIAAEAVRIVDAV